MTSANYDNFIESLNAAGRARADGIYVDGLQGEDKTRAQELLLSIINDDCRAYMALAELDCKQAVPLLKEKLQTEQGFCLIDLAYALRLLDNFKDSETIILSAAKDDERQIRNHALHMLQFFDSPSVVRTW